MSLLMLCFIRHPFTLTQHVWDWMCHNFNWWDSWNRLNCTNKKGTQIIPISFYILITDYTSHWNELGHCSRPVTSWESTSDWTATSEYRADTGAVVTMSLIINTIEFWVFWGIAVFSHSADWITQYKHYQLVPTYTYSIHTYLYMQLRLHSLHNKIQQFQTRLGL